MSDFGYSDHYVAAVKARIYQLDPSIQVIDISHNIDQFDFSHGSYILNSVFRDFPLGTVHIAGVGSFNNLQLPYLALKLEGHFFLGFDNGFFGLISEQEPEAVVQIDINQYPLTSFPEKDIFAPISVKLANGQPIVDQGDLFEGMKKMIGRKLRATKKQISGNVVRVDHYGNLITNIDKKTFDFLSREKTFRLILGRESINQINNNQNFSEDGEIFAFFNSNDILEIGINKGNASELLGLRFDSNISVVFSE
ncbi:MAG: SAM-dependent chlorinase/fluorinase [Bacteroidota bacterium]|nr:SAM-dependent chlorinase/fluorinase [Bacteroidota bacterium]